MTTAPHGGSPADTPPPADASAPSPAPFPQPPTTALPATPAATAWPMVPPSGVDPAVVEARQKAGTAMGWGIAGAVAGGLALLLSLVTFGMTVLGGGGMSDAGSYETIRGTIPGISDGGGLGGDRLARLLEDLEDDYGYSADFSCPDTALVEASTVVVCHGTLDDYEWTGAVLFEDADGSFALVEL